MHKILSRKEIWTIFKDHDCVVNLRNLTHNNLNLDLVNNNAPAKLSLFHELFVLKILNGITDKLKTVYCFQLVFIPFSMREGWDGI